MRRDKQRSKSLKETYIESAGVVQKEPLTHILETNYMPYAMSVILSRALPQIDGFKPSHRKLLYTMYTMGLLKGKLTKSANIVGATMKLNPHGDAAIYETMVRLSRGYEALLHSYIESKGNFGKFYSRDMAYAASRYTEAKLSPICEELFNDIDKDAVDFVPNYDNTIKEPVLLPIRFPAILVNSNVGIAVSMASSICPFNLTEVCTATIKIIKKEKFKLLDVLKGPDFPGGGFLIKDDLALDRIYKTGKGSLKIRSKYVVDKDNGCIDITEIPYTTTVEAIIDKIIALIKENKIREIADVRDETDLNGLKITIDLKRGVDAKNLMQKLFKYTPLEDSYACNFNILIEATPQVLGVKDIILSWQKFRQNCIKRRTSFELKKKEDKLHLLEGLNKILLDIDKAIEIIKKTEKDDEVISNLKKGFSIDDLQAFYIAEMKLRHLNKEYILNKLQEKKDIEKDILKLRQILKSETKVNNIICRELEQTIKKYGQKRKTMFLHSLEYEQDIEENTGDFDVYLVITKEGYIKKITKKSLKLNSKQKLKEKDEILIFKEVSNNLDLLIFSNKGKMYKINLSNIREVKASSFGEFLPAIFKFDESEKIVNVIYTKDYEGEVLFFYENGKVLKTYLKAYKTNRKKILNAFYKASRIINIFYENEANHYLLKSRNNQVLVLPSDLLKAKEKRDSSGAVAFKLKKEDFLKEVIKINEKDLKEYQEYCCNKIPAAGKKHSGQLKLEI